MKQILSEKNIAGGLFILVMVVFSFAHEDSKKRNGKYNVSTPTISVNKTRASITKVSDNVSSVTVQENRQ